MRDLLLALDVVLDIYIWILLAFGALSLLIGFNVVSARNYLVAIVSNILNMLTVPARRPIQAMLPDLGGAEISPIILISLLVAVRYLIALYILPKFV